MNNTEMNFSGALEVIKGGKKVARSGWNGKGMWLALVKGENWGIGANDPRDYPGAPPITNADFIGMKTADNKLVPWPASQTDLLAEDWMIAE